MRRPSASGPATRRCSITRPSWPERRTWPAKSSSRPKNDEAQSRLKKKLARDKLLVYGLTDKEIENASKEDGIQKAKMILRSRADGVVVLRNVVKGNYYTSADLLMTIAPLDHLWVRGASASSTPKRSRSARSSRSSSPSPIGRFPPRWITSTRRSILIRDRPSSGPRFATPTASSRPVCSCGCWWRLPPMQGRTVIPRSAMVTVDRFDYVFIRKPGKANQFDRRQIFTAMESHDVVIVAETSPDHPGLTPGQEVVTTGSLILEQLYEDREMTEGGFLVSRDGRKSVASVDQPNLSIVTSPPDSH